MKNIHILATDKPSRLHEYDYLSPMGLSKEPLQWKLGRNIYITNDEEIKEGDWFINTLTNYIVKGSGVDMNWKYIILTTDADLIKDGVQAIDDEFLEWFAKNPSCEEFEVLTCPIEGLYTIIPKKEQIKCYCGHTTTCDCSPLEEIVPEQKWNTMKQETLEEAIERLFIHYPESSGYIKAAIIGKEWQQERSYSEEDMKSAFLDGWELRDGDLPFPKAKNKWFEQFKKK